jgi:hypothetical protein
MKLPMALLIGLLAAATPAGADEADDLHATIAALDAAVFDAFDHCSDAAHLEAHGAYFADDVEFYHDDSGVTVGRAAMLANTRRHACGRFTRELVPGSLRVHPIKGFGAISQGTHRFCQAPGRCEGQADFTLVWRRSGDAWAITRVLSYGHRAAAP